MKIKAPFVVQTQDSQDEKIVQHGYTVRDFLPFVTQNGKRRRFMHWWLWGYVQSENRLLSKKELEL